MVIGGTSPEGVAVWELGVAPPDSPGTDLEDELPTLEDSVMIGGASPERVAIPELGVAPPDDSETDLEDELLNMSPLPTVVSPLTEPVPVIVFTATCAGSAGPCLQCRVAGCSTPGGGRTTMDQYIAADADLLLGDPSDLHLLSLPLLPVPVPDISDPVAVGTPSVGESGLVPLVVPSDDSGYLPPDSPTTMDQYIAADADLLLGDPSDLHLLSLPLLPVPVADISDPVSVGIPSVGEPWLVPLVVPSDDSGYLPPDSLTTMDQYIAADAGLLLGDPSDLHLLSLPLLPVPVADISDPVSVGTPSVGEPGLVPLVVPSDLSQEGPFDVDQTTSGRGTLHGC